MSDFISYRNSKIKTDDENDSVLGFTPCSYMPKPWIDYGGDEITDTKIREKFFDYYLKDMEIMTGLSKETIIRKLFKKSLERLLTLKKDNFPVQNSLNNEEIDPFISFYVNNGTLEPPNFLYTGFKYPFENYSDSTDIINIPERVIYDKEHKAVIEIETSSISETEESTETETTTTSNSIIPLFNIDDKYIFEYSVNNDNIELFYSNSPTPITITDKLRVIKDMNGITIRDVNYNIFNKYIPTLEDMKRFILSELVTVFFYLQYVKYRLVWKDRSEETVFISIPYKDANRTIECGRRFNKHITDVSLNPDLLTLEKTGDFFYYYGYLILYGEILYKFTISDLEFEKLNSEDIKPFINLEILNI